MKIIRILMQNFGPYVNEDIDFTELNQQRLFLLEGKTGCGKSTIIEAIVFALYGKDSKGRDEDVRRNSAPTGENATVTLDFEVEEVSYRVIRSPKMTDRETGKKLKDQKVTLAEIDADGNVIAGRTWDAVKEVGRAIKDIIHLSVDQFTRIVVLPQGQFSKFLRSKSDERQALLEAIFPVDNWKEIQKRIKNEAKVARDKKGRLLDVSKQAAAITRDHTNDLDALEEKDAEHIFTSDQVRTVQSEAESKIVEWDTGIVLEEEKIVNRREKIDTRKNYFEERTKMNKAIAERAILVEKKSQISILEKSITPMVEALAKHHDSERLRGILKRLESANNEVLKNVQSINEHVNDAGMDAGLKGKSAEEIKQLSDSIADKIRMVDLLNGGQGDLIVNTKSQEGLVKNRTDARAHYGKLQYEQHKEWAALIAKDSLKEGDPCLVCGNTAHPDPAGECGGGDSELKEALAAVEGAVNALRDAKIKNAMLTESIETFRNELELTPEDTLPDATILKSQQDVLEKLSKLKNTNETLNATQVTAQGEWDAAENPHNLHSIEEIDAHILAPENKNGFTKDINDYNSRCAINTNGLQKQEIIAAEGEEAVDISADVEKLQLEMTILAEDEKIHNRVKNALSNLQSSHSTLSLSIEEYAHFAKGMADLQWVDDRLRGTQGEKMKMDIISWILRRWFEAALANANARLAEIGSGRYSLEMTQVGKEEKKTGLNIGVIDALSDSLNARSTNSLSGGESFYISLALALGMSDVVSEEAGGIRLGTLFIDEGFGTLDHETLDDVMCVIDEIGDNNRVIGLISHVDSLKQRIPSRISVTKKGDGTSTAKVEP
jgi:exonuclease SbcC